MNSNISNLELTPEQKTFITENRLELSMNDLSKALNLPYYRVKKFLKQNNLQLTKSQSQAIRVKKNQEARKLTNRAKRLNKTHLLLKNRDLEGFQPPNWVNDPWNRGLNLVTMGCN